MSHCPICLFRFSEFRNTQSALTTVDNNITLGHFICTVGLTQQQSLKEIAFLRLCLFEYVDVMQAFSVFFVGNAKFGFREIPFGFLYKLLSEFKIY
jgi:hypothetical protein